MDELVSFASAAVDKKDAVTFIGISVPWHTLLSIPDLLVLHIKVTTKLSAELRQTEKMKKIISDTRAILTGESAYTSLIYADGKPLAQQLEKVENIICYFNCDDVVLPTPDIKVDTLPLVAMFGLVNTLQNRCPRSKPARVRIIQPGFKIFRVVFEFLESVLHTHAVSSEN
jgi:hypothetical protein